jgi:5-methylcytosine-specific restriction endonuclease McrA
MKEDGGYSAERYYDEFGSWSEALEIAGYDPDTTVNGKVTKEKLIADIQRVADEIGRSPSSSEYANNGEHSNSPVFRIFDSWEDALEAADLECLNFKKVAQITDKQELIDALREDVQRLGHVPTRDELNEKGTYTDTTYLNHFGSYNTALKKAGFPVNQPNNTLVELECFACGSTVQKAEWKLETRENVFCSQECLHSATVTEPCDHCGNDAESRYVTQHQRTYCDYACRVKYYKENKIARVDEVCTNCGIEFACQKSKADQNNTFCSTDCFHEFQRVNTQDLVDDYKKTAMQLNETPGVDEITEHCRHGLDTFYRHFDSLIELADAAGVERPYRPTDQVECDGCGKQFKQRPQHRDQKFQFCERSCYLDWTRRGNQLSGPEHPQYKSETVRPNYGPNWRSQREKARERDDFTCQSCGMTKKEHLKKHGFAPHVHHIKPWNEFDDHEERNKLSNLIVLCVSCHGTWEKLPVNPQLSSQ